MWITFSWFPKMRHAKKMSDFQINYSFLQHFVKMPRDNMWESDEFVFWTPANVATKFYILRFSLFPSSHHVFFYIFSFCECLRQFLMKILWACWWNCLELYDENHTQIFSDMLRLDWCASSEWRLPEALFMGFLLNSTGAKGCKSDWSNHELSTEYLVAKRRHRYSRRERAPQSLNPRSQSYPLVDRAWEHFC